MFKVLAIFFATTGVALADCDPLSTDQIYDALNDMTISGVSSSTGMPFSEFLSSEGTTFFKSKAQASSTSRGIWHSNLGMVCFSYQNDYGSFVGWSCKEVVPVECDGSGTISGDLILRPEGTSNGVVVGVSAGDVDALMDRNLAVSNEGIYSRYDERINETVRDVELSKVVFDTLTDQSRHRASFRESFTTLPGRSLLNWDSSTGNSGWTPIEYTYSTTIHDGDLFFQRQFTQQLTSPVFQRASSSELIDVLALEGCGPVSSNVGLLRHPKEWEDTVRILVALEALGLEFPFEVYGSVRHPAYGGTATLDEFSLEALNLFLLGQYETGKLDRQAVVIDPSDGCGAGEISVTIVSDGTLERLQVIPKFYFSVCEANSRDPWSSAECPFWSEVVSEQPSFAGTYTYVAEWNDGETTSGSFAVTEAQVKASWNATNEGNIIRINR